MTLLLRRTATWLYAAAVLILALALAFPFAERMALFGFRPAYGNAVLAVLAVTAIAGAFNLGHQAYLSTASGAVATFLACAFIVGAGGVLLQGDGAVGFGLYLAATGMVAAAALMAFTSTIEERRHGPLPPKPRAFRAQPKADDGNVAQPGASSTSLAPPTAVAPVAPAASVPAARPVWTPLAPPAGAGAGAPSGPLSARAEASDPSAAARPGTSATGAPAAGAARGPPRQAPRGPQASASDAVAGAGAPRGRTGDRKQP